MTVVFLSLAPGFRSFDLLYGGVDDSSLIGIHRLKRVVALVLQRLFRHSLAELLQSFLSFLTVVLYIKGDAVIGIVDMICDKTREILKRVERLSAMSDNKSDIVAGQNQLRGVFFCFLNPDLGIKNVHLLENLLKILRRRLRGFRFDKCAYFCGTSSEQSEEFLFRHLKNFAFRFGRFHAELSAGVLKSLYNRIAGRDCFS